MIKKATPELLREWNTKLAEEGLSVWEGTDDHLLYMHGLPDSEHNARTPDLQILDALNTLGVGEKPNWASTGKTPQEAIGDAGGTDTMLYLQAALSALTDVEKELLRHYATKTAKEIAALYQIRQGTAEMRINRLLAKVRRMAYELENRP